MSDGPPPDPREGRFVPLAKVLRNARWIVALAAVLTLLLGEVGREHLADALATAIVVVLVGIPMARTAWFARRWATRGDPRFAVVAGSVLALPPLGLIISLLLQ